MRVDKSDKSACRYGTDCNLRETVNPLVTNKSVWDSIDHSLLEESSHLILRLTRVCRPL